MSKSVANGHYQDNCEVNLVEVRRKRTVQDMQAAGEHLCLVLQAGQSFMHDLGSSHEEHVVYSHGDHIPLKVRNGAVVAFWLPDFLDVALEKMTTRQAKDFWTPHVAAFLDVAEYVAKRMHAYCWPLEFDLKTQYRDLLIHWCQLCRRPEVRKEILLPRDENAQGARRPAGILAAGCKYCEVRTDAHQARQAAAGIFGCKFCSQTGEVEHGVEVIQPGLEFKYTFQWEVFWAMVHTGRLPSGAVLDFVPDRFAAAFAVFHFSGMFGTSEAHAESVGGTLKMYAKSFSTSRVVESTMLRQHGLKGCGGGSEDAFLEVCWAHFFGSADASKFTFQYRNSKTCKKRAVKNAEGGGSKTLTGYLQKFNDGVRWSQRDLHRVAKDLDAGPRIAKSAQWGKVLKERREHVDQGVMA